jgi:hypothetical protein
MTDNDPLAWQSARWAEFEQLGEAEVRKHIVSIAWGEGKIALAKQWLDHKSSSDSAADRAATLAEARAANELARAANSLAEAANVTADAAAASAARSAEAAKTNNIIATIALIAAVIAIAVSVIGIFLK